MLTKKHRKNPRKQGTGTKKEMEWHILYYEQVVANKKRTDYNYPRSSLSAGTDIETEVMSNMVTKENRSKQNGEPCLRL